ncbi:MAG TPA: hypothetical protein VGD68_15410 [Streptosporangiaceae bacterium]
MRTNKSALKKLALAVTVPGVAFGTLAGVVAAPALASTPTPPVYERIAGYSNGLSDSIHVQVTGGFFDNGTVSVNLESGSTVNVNLGQGTQTLHLTPTNVTGKINQATCSGNIRATADLYVSGGTGAYFGLTGDGTATLTGNIGVPRVHGGCLTITPSNFDKLSVHLNVVATAELSPEL